MNQRNLKWQLPFLAILIIGTVLILRKQAPYQTDEGFVFGTVYKITYQSKENLKPEIEAELKKVDNSLSPFNKQSVITHINNNTDLRADSMLAYIYKMAKGISEETQGAYDITVAPLVNAWGFGFKTQAFPDSAKIDSIREIVGYKKIRLNDNGTFEKTDPRIMLDCSSIAKGYGVDCVARLLASKGIRNFMVEIGGEVVTKGENPKMEKWKIGINRPVDDSLAVNQELQTILEITDAGMATSGNYRNFYYKDGKNTLIPSTLARATLFSTTFFHPRSSPTIAPKRTHTPPPSWCSVWTRPKSSATRIRNLMHISSIRMMKGNCRLTLPRG